MFKYETHMHTLPASKCASVSVRDALEFYKSIGYDGVFITNHFLDSNLNIDRSLPYEERLNFFFADYEEGLKIGKEIGLRVFCGVELTNGGTDFLIYGLDKAWYMAHPEIMEMQKSRELPFMMENGAFVVQAHPFREARYIDHIRLYPRHVYGVEVINANRTEFENKMAHLYAEEYGLLMTAGSDNHCGERAKVLAGMMCEEPVTSEADFAQKIRDGKMQLFTDVRNPGV